MDVLVCSLLAYVSVWIYELGNYLVLSASGADVSMAFLGALPIGVSAVTSNPQGMVLAKPLQVLITGSAMLAVLLFLRSRSLPISTTLASATFSVYLASSYWEILSLVGSSSYFVHLAGFTLLALAAQTGISRALRI